MTTTLAPPAALSRRPAHRVGRAPNVVVDDLTLTVTRTDGTTNTYTATVICDDQHDSTAAHRRGMADLYGVAIAAVQPLADRHAFAIDLAAR